MTTIIAASKRPYRSWFALFIALALLAPGEGLASNRDETIGLWRVVTIRVLGKQRQTVNATLKIWKLRNGTFRSTGRANVKGVGRVRSEGWTYRNGTTEGYTNVNGELTELSEGTWRREGTRTYFFEAYDSLSGTFTVNGHSRRVNRDKFVSFSTIKPGGIRQTSTATRIRK